MALINVGASFPQYMWAVTRLLLASDGKLAEKDAKLLLTPPSLTAGENDEYDVAVKTLADLDIVTRADGIVALRGEARTLSSDDVTGFNGLLRRAALDPARNVGLAETDDLGGAKDLVRALAWFLTQDPATSLDWGAAGEPPGWCLSRPSAAAIREQRAVGLLRVLGACPRVRGSLIAQ